MTEQNQDKRHSVRISARLEAHYWADGVEASGFIDDLSESGAWIDTQQPLPVGERLQFRFSLHDEKPDEPIEGAATVVRSEPAVGMAVEFDDLPTDIRSRLRFYVAAVFFGQDPAEMS